LSYRGNSQAEKIGATAAFVNPGNNRACSWI